MDYNNHFDDKNIRALLQKYWQGESELEEEIRLKEYFNQANIAPDLLPYKDMFVFFKQEKNIQSQQTFNPPSNLSKWCIGLGIVLFMSLFIGITYLFYWNNTTVMPNNNKPIHKEYKTLAQLKPDEQKAYKDAKNALLLVSSKLNKGKKQAISQVKNIRK